MEVLADALKGLPNMIASRLMQLKNMDRFSKETLNSLIEEENKFLDDLKSVPKDADESQLLNKSQSLFDKRHEVVTMLDNQMKNIQRTYDQIDKKIAYLDHSTKNINYLFPFNGDEVGGSDQRKKKKRKVSNLDDGGQEQIPIVDSNEPLYCTCRQVSYGQMIACDNPDCQVEWFHFSCVGLLIEPTQWTCSECMGAGSSEVDKSEGLLDFDN